VLKFLRINVQLAMAKLGKVAPYFPALVGGQPLTNGIDTVKTIANYYAHATTIFDYTRRAMLYNMPRSGR